LVVFESNAAAEVVEAGQYPPLVFDPNIANKLAVGLYPPGTIITYPAYTITDKDGVHPVYKQGALSEYNHFAGDVTIGVQEIIEPEQLGTAFRNISVNAIRYGIEKVFIAADSEIIENPHEREHFIGVAALRSQKFAPFVGRTG
jgi:hypothetical protein